MSFSFSGNDWLSITPLNKMLLPAILVTSNSEKKKSLRKWNISGHRETTKVIIWSHDWRESPPSWGTIRVDGAALLCSLPLVCFIDYFWALTMQYYRLTWWRHSLECMQLIMTVAQDFTHTGRFALAIVVFACKSALHVMPCMGVNTLPRIIHH